MKSAEPSALLPETRGCVIRNRSLPPRVAGRRREQKRRYVPLSNWFAHISATSAAPVLA
ncbi:hypothetical protein KCP78_08290 [Salmonella enterica subsp. enterica]|nr:hypothetical protein KCP78_08290 [Salmonella enterica subsp. enterica]